MRYLFSICLCAALVMAVGCDKAKDDNGTEVSAEVAQEVAAEVAVEVLVGDETEVAGEASLPVCPDEVELTGFLPCNCYGQVATDPDAQVPDCITQVVCCPAIGGLRCEDHELLEQQPEVNDEPQPEVTDEVVPEAVPEVAPEAVEEAVSEAAEEVWIHACPYEVKLNAYTPCMCGEILVQDVESAYPGCAGKVVCCPHGGVKCE